MSGSEHPKPKTLRKEGEDHLVIEWDDGKLCKYAWRTLRAQCPCAGCREEREQPPDPLRILSPAELQPLKPVKFEPVGYYAYKITWSDGHDTGLFTLEFLRQLCDRDK
ncbi:MAG: gamma-butyrobetaine hydroxylase-like domain-containing protein [Gemmataceae bacterium]